MKMKIEKLIEDGEVIFLAYLGFITQPLVTSMIDALETLEASDEDINFPQKLYIVFIEMAQNIMHYAEKGDYKAFILIGQDTDEKSYYVLSKNLIKKEAKERIERSLKEIENLDRKAIRQLYKERRRSGKDAHEKGGGIGFLEMAKIAKKLHYEFEPYNEDKYIFSLKTFL